MIEGFPITLIHELVETKGRRGVNAYYVLFYVYSQTESIKKNITDDSDEYISKNKQLLN